MVLPQTFTLSNGLRVIVVERPQSPSFAAALTYDIGSYDDPADLPGVAHFSEHLAFRGANRPIVEELSSRGAAANAQTGTDHTQFFVSGPLDQFETAAKFFSNLLASRPIDDDEVKLEQNVFRHELSSSNSHGIRDVALDRYWRSALGDPNFRTSLRKAIARISGLTASRVNSWRQTVFHVGNACLAVVSGLSADQVQAVLERHLAQITPIGIGSTFPPRNRESAVSRITIGVDRNSYVWIYLTHVLHDTDATTRLVVKILSNLLGEGSNSLLFQRLRMDRPLAYAVKSGHIASLACTAVYSFCSVQRKSVREAIDILLTSHQEIIADGIDEACLALQKDQLRARYSMWPDYPRELATYLAHQMLRPSAEAILDNERLNQLLADLTLARFRETTTNLLQPDNRYVFADGRLGPVARFHLQRQLRNA